MSALFNDPVLVEVFPVEGDAVRFVATHRGVPYRKSTTVDGLQEALARHLCKMAETKQITVGAVVFNAGTPRLDPLHFFVATDRRMRDADAPDEASGVEVTVGIEDFWEKKRKEWVRKHKLSRRPVAETVPPAPAVREYEDDELPLPGELPAVEAYEPPAPTREVDPWEGGDQYEGPSVLAGVKSEGAAVSLTPIVTSARPAVCTQEDLDNAGPYLEQKMPVEDRPKVTLVSELPSLMDEDKHPQHAQDGWRSSVNALGFRLKPGKDEKRRRDLIDSILAGWNGPKVAMLLNEKGSGGKTPWALLLAAALQRHSRGRVVVRDGNPTGNANERAEYVAPLGRHADGSPLNDRDLARYFLEHGDLDAAALSRFLHLHTTDKFGLVSNHVPDDDQDQLVPEEVDASLDALMADHVAVINDSGNNPYERRDVAVLLRADQLIMPMLTDHDRENGVRKTAERLEKWSNRPGGERYGALLKNSIVVVNMAADNALHRARAKEYETRWEGIVREVKIAPFDPHMASHNLRFDDLRLPTRTAVLEVAAAVAEGFRGGAHSA